MPAISRPPRPPTRLTSSRKMMGHRLAGPRPLRTFTRQRLCLEYQRVQAVMACSRAAAKATSSLGQPFPRNAKSWGNNSGLPIDSAASRHPGQNLFQKSRLQSWEDPRPPPLLPFVPETSPSLPPRRSCSPLPKVLNWQGLREAGGDTCPPLALPCPDMDVSSSPYGSGVKPQPMFRPQSQRGQGHRPDQPVQPRRRFNRNQRINSG